MGRNCDSRGIWPIPALVQSHQRSRNCRVAIDWRAILTKPDLRSEKGFTKIRANKDPSTDGLFRVSHNLARTPFALLPVQQARKVDQRYKGDWQRLYSFDLQSRTHVKIADKDSCGSLHPTSRDGLPALSMLLRSFGVIGAMVAHRYFRCFLGRFFFRSCSASQRSFAWDTEECGRMLPMTRDGNPTFLRSSSRRSTSMYTSSGSRHFFSNALKAVATVKTTIGRSFVTAFVRQESDLRSPIQQKRKVRDADGRHLRCVEAQGIAESLRRPSCAHTRSKPASGGFAGPSLRTDILSHLFAIESRQQSIGGTLDMSTAVSANRAPRNHRD